MVPIIIVLLAGMVEQAAPKPALAVPRAEDQIAGAVQAAPEDRRAEATVLGYDAEGSLVTLRKGANELVCLADDPADANFSVACYHKDLEPFMARGRALIAQGVTGKQREEIRWKEIDAGTLAMPREPRSLHVLTGSAFDAATGTVQDAFLRWVIYTPYATPESTGLATKAVPGGPWLMFAGTPSAHIMMTPAKPSR